MKKAVWFLIPAGVCLGLSAFFSFALVGYSFLGLCFAALAGLILVFLGLRILSRKHEKAARRLRIGLAAALAVFALAAAVTEGVVLSGALSAHGGGERYAIVLGAGVNGSTPSLSLRRRLEAALDYAQENPGATLILSGGQGRGEDISEAQCMFEWLTGHGVDPERLVLEDRSSSTLENLQFSREILTARNAAGEPLALITAGYHIARAKLMAADLGYPPLTSRGASTGWPLLELNYYLREIPAIWWYLLTR